MNSRKWLVPLAIVCIVLMLTVVLVPTASAAVTRSGQKVEVKQGEIIPDDLYAAGDTVLINGTVQGDLVVFGNDIVIGPTGIVEGDILGAGKSIEIKGSVKDDVRVAGAVIVVDQNAQIGDDLVSGAVSLETKSGSTIGGAMYSIGYQAKVSGDVTENLTFTGNKMELQGKVGGNAKVDVSGEGADLRFDPFIFIPNVPAVPNLPSGLTIAPEASIGGTLVYQAPQQASIPTQAVSGPVEFTQVVQATKAPETLPGVSNVPVVAATSSLKFVVDWVKNIYRNFISLLVVGLLLTWLFPAILSGGARMLRARPWSSLGVGALTGVAFWVLMPFVTFLLFAIAFLLGLFSLGGLVLVAFLAIGVILLGLVLAFVLAGSFFSKLIISYWFGGLILGAFKTPAAEHRLWPWLLGLVIYVLITSIPYLGWLVNFVAVLFGLGAFVLWIIDQRKPSM